MALPIGEVALFFWRTPLLVPIVAVARLEGSLSGDIPRTRLESLLGKGSTLVLVSVVAVHLRVS